MPRHDTTKVKLCCSGLLLGSLHRHCVAVIEGQGSGVCGEVMAPAAVGMARGVEGRGGGDGSTRGEEGHGGS